MDYGKAEQSSVEKITVNLNVVEIGYIDILVSEGFYSNRSDFIKSAVRRQLDTHAADTKNAVEKKKPEFYVSVGVGGFTKAELEKMAAQGRRANVVFIGLFSLPANVTLELLQKAVESIKVYGVCRCSQEIKKRYSLK